MSEKTEEELIGRLVKLRKHAEELHNKIDVLLKKYDGEFQQAITEKWGTDMDLDRGFRAKMSVNPDVIVALAEKLRSLQKEYSEAHQELREFENKNLVIVQKYGGKSMY